MRRVRHGGAQAEVPLEHSRHLGRRGRLGRQPGVPAPHTRGHLGEGRGRDTAGRAGRKARAETLCAAKPERRSRKAAPARPSIDSALVGRRVSAVWENTYVVKGRDIVRIESCPGVILRLSTKETKVKNRKIGLGHIYIKYDEGEENDHCWWKAEPKSYRSEEPGGWKLVEEDDEESGLESFNSDSDISGDEISNASDDDSSSSDETDGS